MSRFFVGQRVRLVNAESFPQLIGTEARVKKLGCTAFSISRRCLQEGMIQLDIPAPADSRHLVAAKPEWLEPILPEGSTPSEYSFQQLLDSLQEVSA